MPAPAWENLDDFLSTDDFAFFATFVPNAGTGEPRSPVPGIFDEPACNAEAGEFDAAVSEPKFTCKASDVVGIRKNDRCIVSRRLPNGSLEEIGRYLLDHDPHPDGAGLASVMLSRDFE